MNSSLDPNNSFTNLNLVFLQGHYRARQSCSLTQRWTRNWTNCKHTHTHTHTHRHKLSHTHVSIGTDSIPYTTQDDCFFFHLILLSSFLSFTYHSLPVLFVFCCPLFSYPLFSINLLSWPNVVQNCPDLSESWQQQQWQRCGGAEGGAEEGLPQEEHPSQEENGGGK